MAFETSQYISEDGAFTDQKPGLLALLGDEYKDSKALDDVPDVLKLTKAFIDTKKAYGQKLEGVIQKPPANATPEQKAAYRQGLLGELGAAKTAEELGFTRPELPEGLAYDEAADKFYADLFVKLGVPKDIAVGLRSAFIEQQVAAHNQKVKDENTAFDKDVTAFQGRHSGAKLTERLRMAHQALMHFAAGDTVGPDKQTVKGLKTLLTEAKIGDNDNITDFKLWRQHGITPTQLELWANIGDRMKSGFAARDEGPGGAASGGAKGAGGAPQGVKEAGAKYYDHPTSKELVERAG